MTLQALLLGWIAAASWAVTHVLMKSGLRHMDLLSFALSRLLFGVILVFSLGLLASDLQFPGWRLVLIAASGGIMDSLVGTALYMLAVRRAPAHVATSLANTSPLWGVIGAAGFLGEPLTVSAAIAALLVVIGVWLLSRQRRTGRTVVRGRYLLAALLAGVCWGLASAVPTKYCIQAGMRPTTVQLSMLSASTIGWGLVYLFRRRGYKTNWTKAGVRTALFTSITGYVLGWALWLRALSGGPAVALSSIRGGGMTFFAFVLSMAIFRERPRLRAFLGVVSIIAGIITVSWFG